MAENEPLENNGGQNGETQEGQIDYKALYESEKANAEKWKAMSRKNEEAYKKASSDAALAAEGEKAALKQRAEKAELEAEGLRKEKELAEMTKAVASKHGIPGDLVGLIKGDSLEELDANAERVKAFIPTAPVITDSGYPGVPKTKQDDKKQFVKTLFSN